jgi:uncharacterized membrane protein YraQ (UPF0718 family)
MTYFQQYFASLSTLVGDLWVLFLIGFLAAGVVAEFVPRSFIAKHFGNNDIRSLLKAALSGLVASTCSCGAIPMAVSLREKGASTAVALTFLLATPWSGVPQFLVLSNFLGVANTALLMVCAVIAAFLSGLVLSRLEKRGIIDAPKVHAEHMNDQCAEDECSACATTNPRNSPRNRFAGVLRHAWDNLRDLGKYLAIGVAIAAAVAAFVPNAAVQRYLGAIDGPWSILLAVPISAIIELCSEGFSVFAGQLYTMGASLGVVFVMLMVGVTTDITEISVVWGKFGRRSAVAYILVSTTVALAIAYAIDISKL